MTLAERLSQLTWGGNGFPTYAGEMKGDHSAAEQAAADQQRAMENQLMQQQLSMQQQQIGGVNKVLDPLIAAGGMNPQQQAALTSIFMNQVPQDFNNLQGRVSSDLVARGVTGGNMAGSGDIARNFGQVGAMENMFKAQGLSQIQLQKQQQLMAALGAKMGVANLYGQNVGGFNSGAIGAGNTAQQAAKAADEASTSFWGSLIGGLTGIGRSALTGGASPAFPNMTPGQISGAFGGPTQATPVSSDLGGQWIS